MSKVDQAAASLDVRATSFGGQDISLPANGSPALLPSMEFHQVTEAEVDRNTPQRQHAQFSRSDHKESQNASSIDSRVEAWLANAEHTNKRQDFRKLVNSCVAAFSPCSDTARSAVGAAVEKPDPSIAGIGAWADEVDGHE
ncbi:hypothetical protein H2200_000651 [Cladophialophora chaetospira]|uniref:Uncharacterized protein n=1 Tax=Cladophialophora chaetospira TaxID=386627 RepID=A0AA39CR67_9EURO|nr:hypothetical protein H2200_000651 [Cladophialophora chaetospira]